MFVALQVEFTSLQLHDFHHGARESGQICGQSRLDAIQQLHGTTYYLVLTNSALRLSPRCKYNVPVNIFTTTTCSFFLTLFLGAAFFRGMTSGNSPARASPEVPLVVLVPTLAGTVFFALATFCFLSADLSLNSCENFTLFWLWAAPSLPLLLLESSLLLPRFLVDLDVALGISLESSLSGVSL
mmetsp:Transcript_20743/g.31612  ORF Transcript_20743/g.31612 Transcript_20743/m.31612 type:complete len:184 (+) Transcript_20743:75-626(+)